MNDNADLRFTTDQMRAKGNMLTSTAAGLELIHEDDAERLAAYLRHLETAPAAHWIHKVHTDHHHGLVTESVTKSLTLTPEEAIASRIRRLRATPPGRGWTRDGMTLHIHDTNPDRDTSITYLPASTYTQAWRTYWGAEEDRAPEKPAVMDAPLPNMPAGA